MINTSVIIRKIDNISIYIDTEDFDFLCLLREKFSFMADGYRFHPAFKSKHWDGKIHLLNVDGNMPYGLWKDVVKVCNDMGKEVFVDPQIKTLKLPREKLQNFVDNLNITVDGESITPYDYQVDAALFALNNQRSLLLSPTSSGKSCICYILIRMYQKIYNQKILILVPSVGLVQQMISDFADYSSTTEWNTDDNISGITKGKLDNNNQIVISTWQSLTNAKTKPDPVFFEQFKTIINDEVHLSAAKSIISILNACVYADTRVGLTGTLKDAKANSMTLTGLFGEVLEVITTKELMDQNKVANLKVRVIVLKYPDAECKFLRSAPRGELDQQGKQKRQKAQYAEEIPFITQSQQRNKYCMNLAASLQGNTIMMINEIEHGVNLTKWLKAALPDRSIYLYNGSVKKDQREEIRKIMEEETNAIIVGSMGCISTGISIKRLHNLILVHPTKSKIKVLQSVGRILRKSKFGNDVFVYDIVDDFSIGAYTNYTLEHGRERCKHYNNQMFDVEVKNITLDNSESKIL